MLKSVFLLIAIAACVRGAGANTIALDTFSGGLSAGTGFAGSWIDQDGNTLNTSLSQPLANGVGTSCLIYTGSGDCAAYRDLSHALLPSTTPEVWVGAYMRPVDVSGYLFGLEVGSDSNHVVLMGTQQSAALQAQQWVGQVGLGTIVWADSSLSSLADNQPTLLLARLYKSAPSDSSYDMLDLYADVNGTDGRYNSLQKIVSGQSLGTSGLSQIDYIDLDLCKGGAVNYVDVGTTESDVTAVAEPCGLAILFVGAAAATIFLRRRS
jgi:hypothetical protein